MSSPTHARRFFLLVCASACLSCAVLGIGVGARALDGKTTLLLVCSVGLYFLFAQLLGGGSYRAYATRGFLAAVIPIFVTGTSGTLAGILLGRPWMHEALWAIPAASALYGVVSAGFAVLLLRIRMALAKDKDRIRNRPFLGDSGHFRARAGVMAAVTPAWLALYVAVRHVLVVRIEQASGDIISIIEEQNRLVKWLAAVDVPTLILAVGTIAYLTWVSIKTRRALSMDAPTASAS